MGDVSVAITELDQRIRQLRENIKKRKYFELGDDPIALGEIETEFAELHAQLGWLDQLFSFSKSMAEKNHYYQAVSAANRTRKFLETVRERRSGSPENTSQFLKHLDNLHLAIIRLADGQTLGESESDNLLQDGQQTEYKATSSAGEHIIAHRVTPAYAGNIYVSYAWGSELEKIVNKIEQALQDRGLKTIRDKRDLQYKGSKKAFVEKIGMGNCVVLVIDDQYLKSPNCMFALVEIAENKRFQDRVFPVVLQDALIYDPVAKIGYVKHWEDKIAALETAFKTLSPANLHGLREDIDLYHRIRDQISSLTSILSDMNAFTPEIHQETNFGQLCDAIEKRMLRRQK